MTVKLSIQFSFIITYVKTGFTYQYSVATAYKYGQSMVSTQSLVVVTMANCSKFQESEHEIIKKYATTLLTRCIDLEEEGNKKFTKERELFC